MTCLNLGCCQALDGSALNTLHTYKERLHNHSRFAAGEGL